MYELAGFNGNNQRVFHWPFKLNSTKRVIMLVNGLQLIAPDIHFKVRTII